MIVKVAPVTVFPESSEETCFSCRAVLVLSEDDYGISTNDRTGEHTLFFYCGCCGTENASDLQLPHQVLSDLVNRRWDMCMKPFKDWFRNLFKWRRSNV